MHFSVDASCQGAEQLHCCTALPVQVFDPWNRRNQFQPSGVAYPAEGGK